MSFLAYDAKLLKIKAILNKFKKMLIPIWTRKNTFCNTFFFSVHTNEAFAFIGPYSFSFILKRYAANLTDII